MTSDRTKIHPFYADLHNCIALHRLLCTNRDHSLVEQNKLLQKVYMDNFLNKHVFSFHQLIYLILFIKVLRYDYKKLIVFELFDILCQYMSE